MGISLTGIQEPCADHDELPNQKATRYSRRSIIYPGTAERRGIALREVFLIVTFVLPSIPGTTLRSAGGCCLRLRPPMNCILPYERHDGPDDLEQNRSCAIGDSNGELLRLAAGSGVF